MNIMNPNLNVVMDDRSSEVEDVMLRLDYIEDSFTTLQEFTVDKLKQFNQRIQDIETKQCSDVGGIREEMEKLSQSLSNPAERSFASPITQFSPLVASTPETFPGPCTITIADIHRCPPMELEDLPDPLREALRTYLPKTVDVKERLSRIQLAFVCKWLDDSPGVTGRRDEGRRLFQAGVDGGMWLQDRVADGVGEPVSYFCEKIRTHARKQRRTAHKKRLNEDFVLIDEVIRDDKA